jgi:hypothetical protein
MHKHLERRKTQRIRKRLPIKFGWENHLVKANTEDISTNGLSIKTHHVFAPGTALMLHLIVNGKSLRAQGEVCWAKRVPANLLKYTRGGMGLHFTSKSEQISEYIQALFPKAALALG